MRRAGVLVAAAVLAVTVPGSAAVSDTASPIGLRPPSVVGQSLDGASVRLPEDLAGAPAVLLVAYRRQTQRDVDLWRGLIEREAPEVRWLEVPTIASPVWRPLAGWIDGGMRGGVPRDLWGNVVTLYRDARALREFLGDRGGYTTHVVVLDAAGTVVWLDAEGFTEEGAAGLLRALSDVGEGGTPPARR